MEAEGPDPILSQFNVAHMFKPCSSKTHFNKHVISEEVPLKSRGKPLYKLPLFRTHFFIFLFLYLFIDVNVCTCQDGLTINSSLN